MLSTLLLAWYDENKRTLPFRGTRDAYRIWVSEIMLQQTRTETVGAYYQRFLQRFPDVFSLAKAHEQEVLKCWEGLGYYSRARNLHKAAKQVVEQYGGVFPADYEALRALPGVGAYTAAAVASIAFDLPHPAIDGNLTRVLCRFHGIREDVGIPSVQRQLAEAARQDMPPVRCGDFNQALMDLGATVCTPGTPDCGNCPLRSLCDAFRQGDAEELPVKSAQKPPTEVRLAVLLITCRGRILMQQRKEALLHGLWVYPLAEDADTPAAMEKAAAKMGVKAKYQRHLGSARHVFTHRVWLMTLHHLTAEEENCREGAFVTLSQMHALPLPTAMRAAREQAEELLAGGAHPGWYELPLAQLHPSQLYISAEKLAAVRKWFDPNDLTSFEPLPVKRKGDILYLTDGHTRAAAAYLAGLKSVPVYDETDDLDWQAYGICLQWCRDEGVDTIEKLSRRIVSKEDYDVLWHQRCDRMHQELGWKT